MLRMLFQVSCWWRLFFPGLLAAEEESEWQAGAAPEQHPGHSAQSPRWAALSVPCLSLWAHRDAGFCLRCWATAGGCSCVPLPQCCWPVLIPCSSEYDFEICCDESKLVRPAGRFHSGSPLHEMLSLNYAQGMDFQVAFFSSFFFFSPVLLLKNSASDVLYTEGSDATVTEQTRIDVVQENP